MTVATRALLLGLALAVLAGTVLAKDDEKEDPAKKFLEGIGKLVTKGDAAGIAAYFPKKGKVELALRGIKNDKYRVDQAKSLLATWFGRIEPKKAKLESVKGTVGKFKLEYRVKADETKVTGTLWVYFVKEEDSWTITGIVEG